jgi:FdhD protein
MTSSEGNDTVFEDSDVLVIRKGKGGYTLSPAEKPVLTEISLRIMVNGTELASMLCLGTRQVELALGFLFSEGVINSAADVSDAAYNEGMVAVIVTLAEGVSLKKRDVLRSITAGCGKCFTYINPLLKSQYSPVAGMSSIDLGVIMEQMGDFATRSDLYRLTGGAHSVLFQSQGHSIFCEDLGRHNCLDKVCGTLLRADMLHLAAEGVVYVSGRVTSEIMAKSIRLGVPVLVSKSTPSVTAIEMAREFNVTLLGYVKGSTGYVYSGAERLALGKS